jgi:tetratricopeptide (TPR) repeat protein
MNESSEEASVLDAFQKNCFMQTLRQFESEINEIADTIKGSTDYERGLKFGRFISTRAQISLIHRCDEFLDFMGHFRKGIFKTVNRKKELLAIDVTTKEIDEKQQASDYYLRAVSYFVLKEFKMARKDLDKAITLEKNFAAAYLLRGFLFELTSKYAWAVSDYSESARLTRRDDIGIFIAMAKRKERDR